MSYIETKTAGNEMTVYLSGRLDSSNAAQTEAELLSALSTVQVVSIAVDAEKLEYISSAGLRVILRLRKDCPDFRIVNVSSDVYEIFDMTGFTEMMTVEKAYRRLSVDGCEVIGEGSNGVVYRLDPDTIIKVYRDADALPDIHRERELARKAFVMGIPTAIPYDVVKVGEGYGSVFELLSARSLTKILKAEPERLDECVVVFAELMKKIHETLLAPGELPSMKEVALGWSEYLEKYLPADKYEKLRALISEVPEDAHMLHGDYHIRNVMIQNGETLLIDMDTLCQGHPVFEIASMFNAFSGFSEIEHDTCLNFLGIPVETGEKFLMISLKKYLGCDDEKAEEVLTKAKVIGYTRLLRRSIKRHGLDSELGRAEYECYRAHLIEAIDRVDTLLF